MYQEEKRINGLADQFSDDYLPMRRAPPAAWAQNLVPRCACNTIKKKRMDGRVARSKHYLYPCLGTRWGLRAVCSRSVAVAPPSSCLLLLVLAATCFWNCRALPTNLASIFSREDAVEWLGWRKCLLLCTVTCKHTKQEEEGSERLFTYAFFCLVTSS